ncbi:PREDICTED: uncharacterized protein LOC108557013 [Nicrophorus vespilloides]|uniref:Uncharacterized protein LOC108557013 n=1 Tax=Nicrophorus vespilloides TaxID=110193 RepID=A0ABM1M2T1_NICVS|nr:PREDICTED: uncharacterized protein LOC108557013 [Nicrophorus vespilloides]
MGRLDLVGWKVFGIGGYFPSLNPEDFAVDPTTVNECSTRSRLKVHRSRYQYQSVLVFDIRNMPKCYATNCTNYYGKTRGNPKVSYHIMPSSAILASRWAKACTGVSETPPRYMRVCSDHFSDGCYQRDLQHELLGLPLRKRLKPDSVPDMNVFVEPTPDPQPKIPMRSSIRIAKRESLENISDLQSPKIKKTKSNFKHIERERLARKIKYMKQLQLQFQKNEAIADEHIVVSPKNEPNTRYHHILYSTSNLTLVFYNYVNTSFRNLKLICIV